MKITLRDARRFLLCKQGLLGEKRFAGEAGALKYIRQAGCIQYDPIDICGRNADLVLQSRVEGYREGMLSSLLYEKRSLVDYWDKNMAIFPMEDWPCFLRTRAGFSGENVRSFLAIEQAAPRVRQMLREKGPSFASDLELADKVDWYWSATSTARAVLETLYFRGELCVHHKRGTQKAYDFAENLLPQALLQAPDPYPNEEEHAAWRLKRRIGGVGMLWNRASDALLGLPDRKAQSRGALFSRLVGDGAAVPVEAEGISEPLYILSQDVPLLEETLSGGEFLPRTQVLAPLDNMLWDRRLIEAFFGFQYTWEIYTPKEKRQYGYYVLPVLQGEEFVGRIELETDRKEGCLRVKGFWAEKGKKPDKRALNRCVSEFAAFQEVQKARWPGKGEAQ